MKRYVRVTALAAVMGWHGQLLAGDEDRLESVEQRLRYLEQRLRAQAQSERAKDARIAELEQNVGGDSWLSRIAIGGLVEVEADYSKADGEQSSSDLAVATVELGIAAQVNDWVGAETVLLYEGDELGVDVAKINIAPPDGIWSLQAGKLYVPFGSFETHMVSDPLTLEIGETSESTVVAGIQAGGFSASAYLFRGTNSRAAADDAEVDNFGANLAYEVNKDRFGLFASVGYVNDISDSDAIQDAVASNDNVDYAAGWATSVAFVRGPVIVIGEYVAAVDPIPGLGNAQPRAWNLEAGYELALAGRDAVLAVGYQGSSGADALELPERRALAALSVNVMENTTLAIELARDEAYDGTDSYGATAQLAVEF